MSTPNLIGERFGRLAVISDLGVRQYRNRRDATVRCRCDCGTELAVRLYSLRGGVTKSCGCLRLERSRCAGGHYAESEHLSWRLMIGRCCDKNNIGYPRYGGRGITVCDRWRLFENFREDMGPKPTPKHTLERTDNNGNYEPGNCRWATKGEQSRNTSANRWITHDGLTMLLKDWATRHGLSIGALWGRLERKWPMDEALSVPTGGRRAGR